MTLKQKSILTSLFSSIILIGTVGGLVNRNVTTQFQTIENQRVERNLRSINAILDENLNQLNAKLADWTIWDDTYQFMTDHNQTYIDSNLSVESFQHLGVDEVLFIDKKGALIASLLAKKEISEGAELDFPQDIYKHFATNSALLKLDKGVDNNKGYIKTEDGVLLFSIREVYKSDGTGKPNGFMVFSKYFDDSLLNTLKALTQLDSSKYLWNEEKMTPDFQEMKDLYEKSNQSTLIKTLNKDTISGYHVLKDYHNEPILILRSDITRDIATQGRNSIKLFMIILVTTGLLTAGINYYLLSSQVLKKMETISRDVANLSKPNSSDRLTVGKSTDEIDLLRNNINKMLDSLTQSKSQLTEKKRFIDIVMDNLDVGIAVNEVSSGKVVYMNHAFEKIYGWSKNVLTSVDTFFESIYPDVDTRKELKTKILADIKTGDPKQMVWEGLHITTSKGNKKIVNARNIPLPDQDLIVSTVIDVTDTKQADEEKKRRLEEMEKLNETMVNRELKMVELKKELEKQRKGEV